MSQNSRIDEFVNSVPVITRALLIINIVVHLIIFVFSLNLNTFAISAHLVVDNSEYYRIVSAAFVHAGIMHIFMNMSSLIQLGLSLEAHFGSLQFLFLTLWSVMIVGILYIILAVLFSFIDPNQMYSSGVGFSGVLFTYALIEAYHTTETSRSIFGMFNVPSRMYPFILLIILQLVIPNISFLGHGAGILVGLLVVHGVMNFLLPSTDFLNYLETTPVFGPLTKASGYIRANNRNLVHAGSSDSNTCHACCVSTLSVGYGCLVHVWNAVAALLYIIGCPVERISLCLVGASRSLQRMFDNMGNEMTPSDSIELGRYARIQSTSDIETATALPPTTTGSVPDSTKTTSI